MGRTGDVPATAGAGYGATDGELAEKPPLPLGSAVNALARCAARTAVLVGQRRIRQPRQNLGRQLRFADGTTSAVYRETVVEGPLPSAPTVLVVEFRLRGVRREWAHALFRVESELNTVLFVGFPGFVSKLWCRHDQSGAYRGFYEWDEAARAEAYVRALWWVLALVSVRGSIHYAVLPGFHRDQVLGQPTGRSLRRTRRGGRLVAPGGGRRTARHLSQEMTFDPGQDLAAGMYCIYGKTRTAFAQSPSRWRRPAQDDRDAGHPGGGSGGVR